MSDPFLKTREETQAWLDELDIEGYTIDDDLTVDVDGKVDISNRNLTTIPVQFGMVSGDFYCEDNQLISLSGCPTSCDNFYCDRNYLTDLTGAPDKCAFFQCDGNRLTSLSGAPRTCDGFSCDNNRLTSLIGAPRECEAMWCRNNHLTSLDGVSGSCMRIYCYENPDLYDISAVPDVGRIGCHHNVVAMNQAAKQLAALNAGEGPVATDVLRSKSSRML